jgi:hypothetical protein
MPGFSWIMTISGHGPASGRPKYARIVALRRIFNPIRFDRRGNGHR